MKKFAMISSLQNKKEKPSKSYGVINQVNIMKLREYLPLERGPSKFLVMVELSYSSSRKFSHQSVVSYDFTLYEVE